MDSPAPLQTVSATDTTISPPTMATSPDLVTPGDSNRYHSDTTVTPDHVITSGLAQTKLSAGCEPVSVGSPMEKNTTDLCATVTTLKNCKTPSVIEDEAVNEGNKTDDEDEAKLKGNARAHLELYRKLFSYVRKTF